ncbi:pentatricopeptide repeat-containing protein At3g61520, mitochondrial-like [Hibiscus syriacus]|nr:pentatricopeptide repeat-containing protein At3g61520, mitochondrial-like [Hibiscus syriacus]
MEVYNKISEGRGNDDLSIEADVVYNTLIDGLCKVERVEEALQLMEQMKSTKGLAPDMVTYTCLINGFCKVGEIERGKELFDRMIEEVVLPDVVSLNILVDGMCKHERINSAIVLFNDMQGNWEKN